MANHYWYLWYSSHSQEGILGDHGPYPDGEAAMAAAEGFIRSSAEKAGVEWIALYNDGGYAAAGKTTTITVEPCITEKCQCGKYGVNLLADDEEESWVFECRACGVRGPSSAGVSWATEGSAK